MSLTIRECIFAASKAWGVSQFDIRGIGREKYVARPRQCAMWLARYMGGFRLADIGHALGGRDHSTVWFGANQAVKRAQTDALYAVRFKHAVSIAAARSLPLSQAIRPEDRDYISTRLDSLAAQSGRGMASKIRRNATTEAT